MAEAFGLDPAMLGGDSGIEPGVDFPVEDIIGGADGPTQTIVTENGQVITTWDGGGCVELG